MELSSEMPSAAVSMDIGAANAAASAGAAASAAAKRLAGAPQAMPAPAAQASSTFSGASGSINFDDDDDGDDDMLAGMGMPAGGGNRPGAAAAAIGSGHAPPKALPPMPHSSGGAPVAAAAGSAQRAVATVSGFGVVLDEDIEEVDDGMLTAGLGLGPVRAGGPGGVGNQQLLLSPTAKPPLPPGAPRRSTLSSIYGLNSSLDEFGDLEMPAGGKPPLPPTPPFRRSAGGGTGAFGASGRRNSGNLDLQPEFSSESFGSSGRRRVRIASSDDEGEGLAPELSVEGSEASVSGLSVASLVMYAPDGVRPPQEPGVVEFLGTSRKRVSWADYAEEIELPRTSASGLGLDAEAPAAPPPHVLPPGSEGSVVSMTEDELLEAQGLPLGATKYEGSELGYGDVIAGSSGRAQGGTSAAAASGSQGAPPAPTAGTFMEVPLKRRSVQQNAYAYKLRVITADKLNAGIGTTVVHVELMGRDATVSQVLPKAKGCFGRGCVDRFTLYSHTGDMGPLLALKVWHVGKTIGRGSWGLEKIIVDDRLKMTRYTFTNPHPDSVLRKGAHHCLVLKPDMSRIDESEDLLAVANEYETQLKTNRGLNESDKLNLRGKLDKIHSRLAKFSGRLAKSLAGSS